jgi:hypothetical protein
MSKSTIYKSTITLFILIVTFLSFSYLSGKDINSFEALTTPEIQTENPQEIIPEPSKEGYQKSNGATIVRRKLFGRRFVCK